ncbi:NAD(P)/FAD-dependent oxidoreductase [Oceanicaulis sp. LC35]|uniref:NAD(P)/FAD-dependent oxidoreductase n=1 Tax=Oceanicaulis sp. LC35 TaxID=3349635 RepID=UPI003F852472
MPSRSLAQNLPDHTLIVGGGAIGLACAWALADSGGRVTVLDAAETGQGAVWASGGMLAAGFEACFELEPDHPLAEPYAAFLRSAQRLWREWAPKVQALSAQALGYDQQGSLTPAFRSGETERLDQAEALAKRFGVLTERVSAQALSRMEPNLTPAQGALVFPNDGQIDNRALGAVLKDAIRSRGGEVIEQARAVSLLREGGRVCGVRLQGGDEYKADCVVLATGAEPFDGVPEFARMIPVKGQMVRFDWPRAAAPQRVVRALSIYLAAKSGGRLIAGASSEPGETSLETDAQTIARLVEAAQAALPGLAGVAAVEQWAGLRPQSRDSMPIVGASEPGLYLALGAYRNGVLAAPGMALLLLESLGATPRTATTDYFSPDRLALRS